MAERKAKSTTTDGAENPRRIGRHQWAGLGLVLGALLVLAAGFWVSRDTVWTDGDSIRLTDNQAQLRRVLWTPAKPLGDSFNTEQHEYEPAVSPDEKQLFFVRGLPGQNADLYVADLLEDGTWDEPRPLNAINTDADELGPRLTPDGRYLLFYSDREGGLGQYDIWASPRLGSSGWGDPINLGPSINSPHNEMNPAVTPNGRHLYFSTDRKAAAAEGQDENWRATIRATRVDNFDLFRAERDAAAEQLAFLDAYEVPGEGLNTEFREGSPEVSPAGDFLYFTSNRPGGAGGFDLYRARLVGGEITWIENLGPEVNSPANETDPQLIKGGFRLFFSSDRQTTAAGDDEQQTPAGPRSYDLFTAQSREVWVDSQGGLTTLAWSWWVLIAALLLLALLAFFSDNLSDRHLNLLQKAIIISLLLHLLLVLLFSAIPVITEIVETAREEAGLEMAVNLDIAQEVQMTVEARSQQTDIPDPTPEMAEVEPVQTQAIEMPAAERQTVAVDVPRSAARPGQMQVNINTEPVELEPPTEPIERPQVAPLEQAPQVTIDMPAQQVTEVERQLEAEVPQPTETTERVQTDAPATQVVEVRTEPLPTEQRVQTMAVPAEVAEVPIAEPTEPVRAARPVNAEATVEVGTIQVRQIEAVAESSATTAVEETVQTERAEVEAPPSEAATARIDVPRSDQQPTRRVTVATDLPAEMAPQIVEAMPTAAAAAPSADVQVEVASVAPSATAREAAVAARDVPEAADRDATALAGQVDVQMADAVTAMGMDPSATANAFASPTGDALEFAPAAPVDSALTEAVTPQALLTGMDAPPGPSRSTSPPSLAHRSFEQRQRLIKHLGGSNESEQAVARALAYLSRNQQSDGRWTEVKDDREDRDRRDWDHDMALTGLAVLCYLGADHTPDKPGPYRQVVSDGIAYLLENQRKNGDLRGKGERGDMYDHGIAATALAEAAAMTGNSEYRKAAHQAAAFILSAQHPKQGGWRYKPREGGDTSVVGWQVMALRSAERTGFEIPTVNRNLALHWFQIVGKGKHDALAAYQSNRGSTPTMTAEALFSRMMLGEALNDDALDEAAAEVLKNRPGKGKADFYGWYYGSLALMQLQDDAWDKWNTAMRPHLEKTQMRGGRLDGSWDYRNTQWGDRAGRIYTTALGCLTLEVYYRYLPMYVEQ